MKSLSYPHQSAEQNHESTIKIIKLKKNHESTIATVNTMFLSLSLLDYFVINITQRICWLLFKYGLLLLYFFFRFYLNAIMH
jgi:hypothetical protein